MDTTHFVDVASATSLEKKNQNEPQKIKKDSASTEQQKEEKAWKSGNSCDPLPRSIYSGVENY